MSDDASDLELGRAVRRVFELLASRTTSADDVLSLEDAARIANTSVRVLREEDRRALPMYGRERSRVVKRGELLAWIERRRVEPADVGSAQQARVERALRRGVR